MKTEKGNIEIHSENIFPIIKKWLYSDRDIFIRELISNACDAITKLKRISSLGEYDITDENWQINVVCDKEASTLTFEDNGIGMSADEVKKYINQVAFSSAEEFVEKYKGMGDDPIIGHFGLGFYSAFMVSAKVEIETLSYVDGSEAVKWTCDGETDYTMETSTKTTRGTKITLFLDDDSKEFENKYSVSAILRKYCSFLPYEIFIEQANEEVKAEEETQEEPKPINDTTPLWQKNPQDCSDEEYKEFYHKVFTDYNDPIFWIHLNVDYPFKLKGILYFPKLSHQFDSMEGQIKLYNNQVYVADNIKEVIPEFLLMLKGVIDCPDLPLNVSRSFLQNDKEVQRIPTHIIKKVATKLKSLANNERKEYETYWEDIHSFIKYGCIRDESFYSQICDYILIKNGKDEYITLKEYLPSEDAEDKKVYYASDPDRQKATIDLYNNAGIDIGVLNTVIDPHFISTIEMKNQGVKLVRIDSEIPDALKGDKVLHEDDQEILTKAFKRATGQEELKIVFEALKTKETVATIRLDEFMRRTSEMSMYNNMGMDNSFIKNQAELVINSENDVIERIIEQEKQDNIQDDVCLQIYDLARLTAGLMEPNEISEFISRSHKMLEKVID